MSTLIVNFNITSSRAVTVQAGGSAFMKYQVNWKTPPAADVVAPETATFSATLPPGVTAVFTPSNIRMGFPLSESGGEAGTVALHAAANAPGSNGPTLAALHLNRAGSPPPIAIDFNLTVDGTVAALPPKDNVKVPDLLGATQTEGTAIASAVGLRLIVSFEFTAIPGDTGIVLNQLPKPGTSVLAGSEIAVKIGRKEPGG